MNINEIAPQPAVNIVSSPKSIQEDTVNLNIPGPTQAPNKLELQRVSIYTDQAGILIAQVKDPMGQVIDTCPGPEVIRRYHTIINEQK